jgi:hypothetical protein
MEVDVLLSTMQDHMKKDFTLSHVTQHLQINCQNFKLISTMTHVVHCLTHSKVLHPAQKFICSEDCTIYHRAHDRNVVF